MMMAAALVLAVAAAGALAVKLWRTKRDIYGFAQRLEESLDALIEGKTPEAEGEEEDSLTGKIQEKLLRVQDIWEGKERESRESKRQIKELISDISHQTRTPIANQKIYLEILRQQELSQEAQGFLDKLERQTDKLDFLFQSLVKLSRLEAGIIQIRRRKEDLVETLQDAVSAVVPKAAAKEIDLTVHAQGPLLLAHDPKWTEEAIYNLLDNAVKYTPKGGQVEVSLKRSEMFSQVCVRDTGKGIPLERQAQIFTRFYREPEVHDQEGIGIGLYLTRQIAELQGGYVEVRSQPGAGASFRLYLPNAQSAGDSSASSQER